MFEGGLALFAFPTIIFLIAWRIIVNLARRRYSDAKIGPLWAFALAAILIPSGLSALITGVERGDELDYPAGASGPWYAFGLIALFIGVGIAIYANTLRVRDSDERSG